MNCSDLFWPGRSERIKIYARLMEQGQKSTNLSIHRESLGISISQELEPIKIFGPNNGGKSCSKNETLWGSHNGMAV